MTDFKLLAKNVVENIGGKENISAFTHCATRLRFNLIDISKANKSIIESIDGVITVLESGGQFQVVIGNEVEQAFEAITELTGINGKKIDIIEKSDIKSQSKFSDKILELVTGIFTPILPVLIGGGMVRALLMLATTYFGLSVESGLYVIFNEIYNAVYSFLPIYLAFSAAQKFKVNTFISVAISIAMVSSTIQSSVQSESGLDLFGIGILFPTQGYGSSVIPIIVTIYFMSVLENFLNRTLHVTVKNILTPLLTLIITVPLMFLIIGPLSSYLQDGIGYGYTLLYNLNPVICGIILGGLWQILVVFGLHWGIVPISTINIALSGRDTISGIVGPSNWVQAGAALGVSLKSKNQKVRETALSAAVTGFFSITEPAVYGVTLKYKRPFYISVAVSAVAGGIAGFANSAALAGGPVGVLSFPLFLGEGFIGFVIAMLVAFFGSAVLTYLFGYDKSMDKF